MTCDLAQQKLKIASQPSGKSSANRRLVAMSRRIGGASSVSFNYPDFGGVKRVVIDDSNK